MLRFYSIPPRFASSWKIKIPPTQDNAWIGGIYTVIQFSGLARGRQPLHDGRIGRRQTRLRFAQDARDDCLGDVLLLGQAINIGAALLRLFLQLGGAHSHKLADLDGVGGVNAGSAFDYHSLWGIGGSRAR